MNEKVNRNYKDRLFSFLFGREENKDWTLSLYNAVNGTDYTDPDKIEINTMGEFLYLGMKNDVSFILDSTMNLYEQQSTYNPNMPVRQLIYLGRLYEKYIIEENLNIYGRKQIKLPVPRLITFYNGSESISDRILSLSDAYDLPEDKGRSDVMVQVHLINIGSGKAGQLLKTCKPLEEYTWLVEKIRENLRSLEIEEAVDQALRVMPKSFGIRKYLISNRAEVKDMLLTEYDEAKYMQMFKEEGREEGKIAVLISLVQSGDLPMQKAAEKLGVTVEELEKMMKDTLEG